MEQSAELEHTVECRLFRLIEVGRSIEVKYKFGRNGSQRDFIDSISCNMVVEK